MAQHLFILNSGIWLGDGKISFSASGEQIAFSTRWTIQEEKMYEGKLGISCVQEVEMREGSERLKNNITLFDITSTSFTIELSNDLVGKVFGKGVIDAKTIAWELREKTGFEGFEVYELQDNGEYFFHAEYASTENFRTIIDGRIWKKSFEFE